MSTWKWMGMAVFSAWTLAGAQADETEPAVTAQATAESIEPAVLDTNEVFEVPELDEDGQVGDESETLTTVEDEVVIEGGDTGATDAAAAENLQTDTVAGATGETGTVSETTIYESEAP